MRLTGPDVCPESIAPTSGGDNHDNGRFTPCEKLLRRYQIIELRGRGGMGEVYLAKDLILGESVALKFLRRRDGLRRAHILEEVRLARRISHPNVCRVYDCGDIDGDYFLIMEYIDGNTLRNLLRRLGRVNAEKALGLGVEIARGLAAAHQMGILHRDLKPANIMIDDNGRPRITDFGLAGSVGEGRVGEIRGTPTYMAPEQWRQGETTKQSDLYALGLVLSEMFTGRPAFGETPWLPPPRPGSLVDALDPAVERVILSCLMEDPGKRPASATDVAAALGGRRDDPAPAGRRSSGSFGLGF